MKVSLCSWFLTFALVSSSRVALAEEVAPGLAAHTLADAAGDALRAVVASLPLASQRAVTGIYVAIDPTETDVLALPACDDDGDYVVVLSRALLELTADVAYASASDQLRGSHLMDDYGELLARAQRLSAPPLPPPAPLEPGVAAAVPLDDAAHLFERSLLTWIVGDDLGHVLKRDLTCPRPTATHERADDVWTAAEHDEALARAPARMAHLDETDAWATARVLALGLPEAPIRGLLAMLPPFEEARVRGDAWTYVTLHPGGRDRSERFERDVQAWRRADRARSETSVSPPRMR